MNIFNFQPGNTYTISKDEFTDELLHISKTVVQTNIMARNKAHMISRFRTVCEYMKKLSEYDVEIGKLDPYVLIIDETTLKQGTDLFYYKEDIAKAKAAVNGANAILILVHAN